MEVSIGEGEWSWWRGWWRIAGRIGLVAVVNVFLLLSWFVYVCVYNGRDSDWVGVFWPGEVVRHAVE